MVAAVVESVVIVAVSANLKVRIDLQNLRAGHEQLIAKLFM